MKPTTIQSKNQSGTDYTITVIPENIQEVDNHLLFRLPVDFLDKQAVFIIISSRTAYPSNNEFLARIEKYGIQELKDLLDKSSNDGFQFPPPSFANAWVINLEK